MEEVSRKTINKSLLIKVVVSLTLILAIVGAIIGIAVSIPKQAMTFSSATYSQNKLTVQIDINNSKAKKDKTIKISEFEINNNGKIVSASAINGSKSNYVLSSETKETTITVVFYLSGSENQFTDIENNLILSFKGNRLKFKTPKNVII